MPLRDRARAGVERLGRVIDASLLPGGAIGLVTWKPRSVAAMRLNASLSARGLSFSSVIDVGANVGQFSRAALAFWPDVEVVAFEPLPACASKLEQALRPFGRVEVHAVALGRDDGIITFHPHEYSLSSSVLPAARNHGSTLRPELASIEVPVLRMDSVLAERRLKRPTLLKLDVQGFEIEVLAGAKHTLDVVDAVLIEVAFERVYDGQPLFSDVHQLMSDYGWRLTGPLDARRHNGQIVELDCLYEPPASRS